MTIKMTPQRKDEMYNEISEMQAEWNKSWRDKRRWIIVEEGDGTYSIHEHMIDGVAVDNDPKATAFLNYWREHHPHVEFIDVKPMIGTSVFMRIRLKGSLQ